MVATARTYRTKKLKANPHGPDRGARRRCERCGVWRDAKTAFTYSPTVCNPCTRKEAKTVRALWAKRWQMPPRERPAPRRSPSEIGPTPELVAAHPAKRGRGRGPPDVFRRKEAGKE